MVKNVSVMKEAVVLIFFAGLAVTATAQGERFGGETISAFPNYFYVDALHGSDDNEGLTPGTAYATIQKGIEAASDGGVIWVFPGLYREEIDFRGKAVVVQGVASGYAGVPVLHNPNDFAVSFYNGEGPGSKLKNFIIKGNFMAVFISGSSPTLSNLTIVDNMYGIEASDDSDPDISNIIFWNNIYSDLFGCQAQYSRVDDAIAGQGNIEDNPLFVDEKSGDYRLLSNRGRYWSEHDVWILDRITSSCIDGGDPNANPLEEPIPNGNRINMGAYGGTPQASLSPTDQYLPGQASNPNPANGATEVDRYAQLSWTPGLDAVGHNIYFGTENPPPRVSSQSMNQFNPGIMDRGTVYYWRVDELNSKGNLTAGVTWKFTTNFGSAPVPPPKGRACFVAETDVWVDGTLVSISNVAQGQIKCGINSLGKVQEVQEHNGIFTCYDILFESGNSISVAENHYFLAESGQWMSLKELKAGAKLKTSKGSTGIMSVTKRPIPYVGNVYNLNIAGSDRYLVGKDAIIVRDY